MRTVEPTSSKLNERLVTSGFRLTAQREQVYEILMAERDHPTAEDVFLRAKRARPEISLATVYNCLEALVKCGLIRQVNFDRTATRYCLNMHAHYHFHCQGCGRFFDIEIAPEWLMPPLPDGFRAQHSEVSIWGSCPECVAGAPKNS